MNSAFVPRKTLCPATSVASTIAAMMLMRRSNSALKNNGRQRHRNQLRMHGLQQRDAAPPISTSVAAAATVNSHRKFS